MLWGSSVRNVFPGNVFQRVLNSLIHVEGSVEWS